MNMQIDNIYNEKINYARLSLGTFAFTQTSNDVSSVNATRHRFFPIFPPAGTN